MTWGMGRLKVVAHAAVKKSGSLPYREMLGKYVLSKVLTKSCAPLKMIWASIAQTQRLKVVAFGKGTHRMVTLAELVITDVRRLAEDFLAPPRQTKTVPGIAPPSVYMCLLQARSLRAPALVPPRAC